MPSLSMYTGTSSNSPYLVQAGHFMHFWHLSDEGLHTAQLLSLQGWQVLLIITEPSPHLVHLVLSGLQARQPVRQGCLVHCTAGRRVGQQQSPLLLRPGTRHGASCNNCPRSPPAAYTAHTLEQVPLGAVTIR